MNHHVAYKEGLLTGYRWFDAKHQAPLFPFGFGLSYTTFKLDHLKVFLSDSMTGHQAGAIKVIGLVNNTGKLAGSEVVQVYVGPKQPGAGEPVKRLHSFARVSVAPGENERVEATIPVRDLATWDTSGHQWVVKPGTYVVYVGTSSRDVKPFEVTVKESQHFAP